MYVCLCKGVTDHAIRDAVTAGAGSLRDVSRELGVARQCGKCASAAKSVIAEALAARSRESAAREAANDPPPAIGAVLYYGPAS